MALFARFVPKGVYEYTYFARATTPGQFKVPPATAYEQYFPEVVKGAEASAREHSEPPVARQFPPLD